MQKKIWIDSLKLAIINENFEQIEALSHKIPIFKTLQESQTALALIKQANDLLKNEKNKILSQMQKLKKTKEFLK